MIRIQKVLVPILLVMAFTWTTAMAQDAKVSSEVVKIKSINSSVLPDKTQVVVETSAPLSLPSSYNLDPLVLVLDIPGADSSGLQKQYVVGSPCVDRINVYQLEEGGRKSITRLEILMTSLVPYRIYSEGSRLFIDFEHLQNASKPAKVREFFKKPSEQTLPSESVSQPAKTEPALKNKPLSGEAAKIQKIDIQKGSGNLQVVVDYKGDIDYKCFELQTPHRLVLDLINAVTTVPIETIHVKHQLVETIRVAQFQSGQPKVARVVFDLNAQPRYDIVPSANQLRIIFRTNHEAEAKAAGDSKEPIPADAVSAEISTAEKAPAPEAAKTAPTPTAETTGEPATSTTPATIETPQAQEATSSPAPTDAPPLTVQASTSEPGTPIPSEATSPQSADQRTEQTLSTNMPPSEASATPTLRTGKRHGKKGIEMAEVPAPLQVEEQKPVPQETPSPEPPPPASMAGTRFEIQTITGGETAYSGEPINMDMVDAPIEQVFRLISTISGLNVITDPGVTGRVTVHFQGVPWDQALDLILKTNGLGYTLENRVVRIAKLDTLASEEQKKRALREARLRSVDTQSIVQPLSYAKVEDMEPVLRKMLSARGEIITDARTNTVIITDIPDKTSTIEKLIGTLDTPTPQVTIQAKIVESTANYTQNIGIQWGFQGIADARHGNQTSLKFPNNILVDGGAVGGTTGGGLVGPLGGYAVNLPAPSYTSGIGISIGNVLDTFRLDAALTALENSGRGRILSAPKITTQNNMKASIIQGREIPVQTTANNTTTTTFKNAALELNVTPQITAEGTIIMVVDVKNDQADFSNLVNGIPPIITQKALATVQVRDGGTSVLGGIYRAEDSFTSNKVPGLHKIPLLGYLFRNSQKIRNNRELLIFLTPRIVRE